MSERTAIPDGEWSGRIPDFARRIGEAAGARRVVLFGSAARGDSEKKPRDLDFLVIVPGSAGEHHKDATRRAYKAMRGLERPAMDIIVVGEDDARRHRQNPYAVVKPALDEGVEVWSSDDV